ncbi:MAG: hypothetical protein JNN15_08370 [Blastocatellia bacterium]|nr:hypothetical protein [Blastocatellia bacterium]
MKEIPDHHDAELVLKLYDMRREAIMRESRKAVSEQFWPKSYNDVKDVMQPSHPLNAAYRQVSTYWEMVYSMAKHSIVNTEFLMESSGEGLFLYAKVYPYVEQLRQDYFPTVFQNAEWISKNSEIGARVLKRFKERIEQVLASK